MSPFNASFVNGVGKASVRAAAPNKASPRKSPDDFGCKAGKAERVEEKLGEANLDNLYL